MPEAHELQPLSPVAAPYLPALHATQLLLAALPWRCCILLSDLLDALSHNVPNAKADTCGEIERARKRARARVVVGGG